MLHIVPCIAVAWPRAKNNHVIRGDFLYSLADHWAFYRPILFPLHRPHNLSCLVPSSQLLLLPLGDQGWVIVTVPALGCPRVSRWDLTRHWLIQPSILAWYRGPNGQWCYKQRGHVWLSILFHPNIAEVTVESLLPSIPFYSIAQESALVSYFLNSLRKIIKQFCQTASFCSGT